MIEGIDVASYQAEEFTIPKDCKFVFIKVSEGVSYTNPKWKKQRAHAYKNGLVVGYYFYAQTGALSEVDYFVKQIPDIKKGEMVVLDWEDKDVSNAEKDAQLKRIKSKLPGHKVGLYCNIAYWKGIDKTSYAGDFLWIADPSAPKGSPRIQHDWKFHQYSSANGLDRNVGDFKDITALRAWAGYATESPVPPIDGPTDPVPTNRTFDLSKLKSGDVIKFPGLTLTVK